VTTAGIPQERHRVLVLLPVYNGGAHLAPLLDAILHQQDVQSYILCRDDGSEDQSVAVLSDYACRHPGQIELLTDEQGNLGACDSFSLLMQHASKMLAEEKCHFVALADQDDIWHAERLRRGVEQLLVHERGAPDVAALVHSDLRVVAENGELIAPSLMAYQGLDPGRSGLSAQLLSNTVTGCTTLLNAALLDKAVPVPPEAVMHDWWLSLVASAFGRRYFINETLVDYRQHGNNTIGARQWQKAPSGRALLQRLFDDSLREEFCAIAGQAKVFHQRHAAELSYWHRLVLLLVSGLSSRSVPVQKLLFRLLRRI